MSIKNIKAVAFLALLMALAVFCLEQGTRARAQWRRLPSPLERPIPPRLTRYSLIAALGDHSRAAADWAYIEALQYIGDIANLADNSFSKMESHYREVLWLDPSFHHAVREGGAILGWNRRRYDESIAFLKDAVRYDPDNERARIYIAALSFHKLEDPAAELESLRAEVERPDASEMLMRIVGNIYIKAEDWDGAVAYWNLVLARNPKEKMTLDAAAKAIKLAGEKRVKGGKR